MNIALTLYRRPELTKSCLENLVKIKGISRIHVFIDGPRALAPNDELQWRDKTIAIVNDFASNYSFIFPKVWNDNVGIVENSKRSFQPLFEEYNNMVITEEDVLLDQYSFDFLSSNISEDIPVLATAYSQSNHVVSADGHNFRSTLFPQLWGAMYNRAIFEKSMNIEKNGGINTHLIVSRIKNFFPYPSVFRTRLINHWTWYFNFALRTNRHPDVLLQYASWDYGVFANAPFEQLSRDISFLDNRGMNIRHTIAELKTHPRDLRSFDSMTYCKNCEKDSCRIESNSIQHYRKSILRKLTKTVHQGEGFKNLNARGF